MAKYDKYNSKDTVVYTQHGAQRQFPSNHADNSNDGCSAMLVQIGLLIVTGFSLFSYLI